MRTWFFLLKICWATLVLRSGLKLIGYRPKMLIFGSPYCQLWLDQSLSWFQTSSNSINYFSIFDLYWWWSVLLAGWGDWAEKISGISKHTWPSNKDNMGVWLSEKRSKLFGLEDLGRRGWICPDRSVSQTQFKEQLPFELIMPSRTYFQEYPLLSCS